MHINIVLDDHLVESALKLSGLTTKKELIITALEEFVRNRRYLNIQDLKAKISFDVDYNYKVMRRNIE